jgi:hypothetical protein
MTDYFTEVLPGRAPGIDLIGNENMGQARNKNPRASARGFLFRNVRPLLLEAGDI